MTTKFVKFAPDKQADAITYEAECTYHYRILVDEPDGRWSYVREDKNGNWTVAMYGPPWEWWLGTPVPEPASCAILRAAAVTVDHPEWPEED